MGTVAYKGKEWRLLAPSPPRFYSLWGFLGVLASLGLAHSICPLGHHRAQLEMVLSSPKASWTLVLARGPCNLSQCDNRFENWGQGTVVTVSSESQSPPTLFPLISCESALTTQSMVTLGCLARDFLPSTVTFSWNFKNTTGINAQNLKTYPSVLRQGKYVASSQVFLPSEEVFQGADEYLVCRVKHSNGNKELTVPLPVKAEEQVPTVNVYIPPRDAFSGSSQRTSKLICQATGFSPKQISLTWLQDGKVVQSGVNTGEVEPEPSWSQSRTFQISSILTISESEWLSQRVFTCYVKHSGLDILKNVSSMCGVTSPTVIKVFTIPPSFAGIFLTKSAKLTCLVTDLATYDSLSISWSRQNGEILKTHTNISESHPNATFTARGEATVCVEDWDSGDKFTCTVTHTDLPSPLKKTISKTKEVAQHAPAIYLMPPTREQLSLRESASVTCLVKSFSPPDVFVQWQHKGQPVPSNKYVTSAPMPEPQAPGFYFAYSILNVSEEEWSAGDTFTCVVGHEALPHMVTERTVDKSTGKPSLYNVSLVMSDTANTCY